MKDSHLLTAVLANTIFWMGLPVRADEAAAIAALREARFKVKQSAGATEIGFGQPEWTPELWQRLGEITSLTVLRGTAKCADNAGLEVLAKLPRLETLYLKSLFISSQFNGRLTGAGKHLAQIQTLESLKVAETVITYDGELDALARRNRLK